MKLVENEAISLYILSGRYNISFIRQRSHENSRVVAVTGPSRPGRAATAAIATTPGLPRRMADLRPHELGLQLHGRPPTS